MKFKKVAIATLLVFIFTLLPIGFVEFFMISVKKHQARELNEKCNRLDFNAFATSRGFSLENSYYQPLSVINHCSTEFNYDYHINKDGLRDHKFYREQPKVLAVGDSFTFGFGVTDEEAFPALLGAYNSGMWGNPFDIQIKSFIRSVNLYHPKKVIWGIYAPHIITMTSSSWNKTCPGDRTFSLSNLLISKFLSAVVSDIWLKSAIGETLLKSLSIAKISVDNGELRLNKNCYDTKEAILFDKNLGNTQYTKNAQLDRSLKLEMQSVLKDMETYFHQAKVIADDQAIQIKFLFIPSRLYLQANQGKLNLLKSYEGAQMDPTLPKSIVENTLISAGFNKEDLIDLGAEFLSQDDWKKYYFKIDAHWNKDGHKFVAETIRRELKLN